MSNTVLIIAGVLILLLLLFLLVARMPNIRQRISGMGRPVVLVLVLLLLAALIFIALKLFLPRGENSLFADAGQEESSEQEETQAETSSAGGFSLDEALEGNDAGDETVYIRVAEDSCFIGTVRFTDPLDLKDALLQLKEQKAIFVLTDDYAWADAYGQVKNMLEELEISYEEIQK